MSKFTKGPWSKDAIFWILRFARKSDGGWNDVDDVQNDEANIPDEDDASLICAAPDLYEVLKAVEWKGHDYDFDEPCCPICHASCGDDHEPDCALNNALLKAGGEA